MFYLGEMFWHNFQSVFSTFQIHQTMSWWATRNTQNKFVLNLCCLFFSLACRSRIRWASSACCSLEVSSCFFSVRNVFFWSSLTSYCKTLRIATSIGNTVFFRTDRMTQQWNEVKLNAHLQILQLRQFLTEILAETPHSTKLIWQFWRRSQSQCEIGKEKPQLHNSLFSTAYSEQFDDVAHRVRVGSPPYGQHKLRRRLKTFVSSLCTLHLDLSDKV